MKKLLLLGGLLSCTAILPGPQFWLQPEKFIVKLGETVNTRFYTGENYLGANWDGNGSGIKALRLYYADVTDDLQDELSDSTGSDSLQLSFFEEGTMMLACIMQSADSTGPENNAKTLVQVGNDPTDTYKRQTLLTVDIIPSENPYRLRDAQKLKVKLYFQKKPLTNTSVQLWHRNNGQTVKTELKTDKKGEVEFPVFTTGSWMISTVKSVDRHSYRGSLTWGYVR
jgi:hypothetical protein